MIIDQEAEYDADVEAVDTEEDVEYKMNSSISSPTETPTSPFITWQPINTSANGNPEVEVAQFDMITEENAITESHWHTVRTSKVEPVHTAWSQSSGWTPINVPGTSTLKIETSGVRTSDTEDTQYSVAPSTAWSVISGSQTDTSQATSVELEKASNYPQTSNTLPLRPRKSAKPVMNTAVDMPQLKVKFREYKKEYTSQYDKDQFMWFKHRIACLDAGNKNKFDYDVVAWKLQWRVFWERRRWLKQEMVRIKNLYTIARRRRQERIRFNLRANYDVGFVKSLAENQE